mgnify:CR=1 FL=1
MKRTASRLLALGLAALFSVGLMGCQPAEDSASNEPAADATASLPDSALTVEQPWVRPGPAGGMSAAYFRLANGTARADTLMEVRTPATDSVSIHETYHPTGDTTVSAMRPLPNVPVPPQQRVALAPGGAHIMLVNLPRALPSGDTLVIDLAFASGDTQRVHAPIRETPPTRP